MRLNSRLDRLERLIGAVAVAVQDKEQEYAVTWLDSDPKAVALFVRLERYCMARMDWESFKKANTVQELAACDPEAESMAMELSESYTKHVQERYGVTL